MNPPRIHKAVYRRFSIGSTVKLSPQSLNRLTRAFSSWENATPNALEGRTAVIYMALPETGPVAIKSYQRGGMMARIINDRYLKLGTTRCRNEFDFLCHAFRAGVSVPHPLIHITRGYPFYKAWLITRQIKDHRSFTRIALEDPARAAQLMPIISKQVRRLIENRIFHVDLHPGNVIIDPAGKPYIIDFDKARFTRFSLRKTVQLLNNRWEKAISKYHLPREISPLLLD